MHADSCPRRWPTAAGTIKDALGCAISTLTATLLAALVALQRTWTVDLTSSAPPAPVALALHTLLNTVTAPLPAGSFGASSVDVTAEAEVLRSALGCKKRAFLSVTNEELNPLPRQLRKEGVHLFDSTCVIGGFGCLSPQFVAMDVLFFAGKCSRDLALRPLGATVSESISDLFMHLDQGPEVPAHCPCPLAVHPMRAWCGTPPRQPARSAGIPTTITRVLFVQLTQNSDHEVVGGGGGSFPTHPGTSAP